MKHTQQTIAKEIAAFKAILADPASSTEQLGEVVDRTGVLLRAGGQLGSLVNASHRPEIKRFGSLARSRLTSDASKKMGQNG